MGANNERLEIAKMYPNKKWEKRVAMMNDNQVLAIYFQNKMREQTTQENQEKQEPDDKQGTLF